jgi:hypothetical protein
LPNAGCPPPPWLQCSHPACVGLRPSGRALVAGVTWTARGVGWMSECGMAPARHGTKPYPPGGPGLAGRVGVRDHDSPATPGRVGLGPGTAGPVLPGHESRRGTRTRAAAPPRAR